MCVRQQMCYFCIENKELMATAIKSIPILKEKEAKIFVKKAEAAVGKRASVNFSKQLRTAQAILKKANMR